MEQEGKYIYCIMDTNEERRFDLVGIGGRGDEVYTVCYQSQAAVVSDSPIIKYPITRENTLTHQRVMEELMREYTLLPVRFGTIAEGKGGASPEERIRAQVLEARYAEFQDLLDEMRDKVELGVKGLWTDMDVIFQEIVEEKGEIRRLRKRIASRPAPRTRDERMRLGEMVKSALDAKRDREARDLLKALQPIAVDHRINKTFGDRMILNAAFLVGTDRGDEFDRTMDRLQTRYDGRTRFKYVGPVPVINFVEIVVTWQD